MTTTTSDDATAAPAIDTKQTKSRRIRAPATEGATGKEAVGGTTPTAKLLPSGSAPADTPLARTSRTDQLMEALRTPDGVSIEDLCTRFGWLPHSARAALTGLRKRGLDVQRAKAGTVTVYRIAAA